MTDRSGAQPPAGLYLHIPFCRRRCGYCDFYSTTNYQHMGERYFNALRKEILFRAPFWRNYIFDSVFFGGGSPSIAGSRLNDIVKTIRRVLNIMPDSEWTIEVNPEDITDKLLDAIQKAGFNRISVGIQSWNAHELTTMGRRATPDINERALHRLQQCNIENINIDLLFGVPYQTLQSWRTTLAQTLWFNPLHISTYSLSVPTSGPLQTKLNEGSFTLPETEDVRSMYILAIEMLKKNGIAQYEISNFSRPGYESRHNVHYWHADDYLGLGASASSFNRHEKCRRTNIADIEKYCTVMESGTYSDNVYTIDTLTDAILMREYIMLSMRLTDGLSLNHFMQRFGIPLTKIIPETQLREWKDNRFIILDDDRIRFTVKGFCVADTLLTEIFKLCDVVNTTHA